MAKIIKLTPECLEGIKKEFAENLTKIKLSDGKFSFTKSFESVKRNATIYFKEIAWLKMQSLIREIDKEVGWHGLAYRGTDPEKDEYIITDILVYPQEVTSATVTTDQEKYQTWLMSHEDEVFNNIRMQGHSHVNMGVTPSGVDNTLYEKILEQLEDDMFYIFMIWNKRGEKTIKIYDMAKNILFETSDCTVKVVEDETGIEKFLRESKQMVTERVYTYQSASSYTPQKTPAQEEKEEPKEESGIRRDNAIAVKNGGDNSEKVRMGYRKKDEKGRGSYSESYYRGYYNSYPYDDEWGSYYR